MHILYFVLFLVEGSEQKLLPLVVSIVQYCLKHNAEEEACDLLMEVDSIDKILEYVTEETHERVCLYLTRYCPSFCVYNSRKANMYICASFFVVFVLFPAVLSMFLNQKTPSCSRPPSISTKNSTSTPKLSDWP